jgi:hypothetical protein
VPASTVGSAPVTTSLNNLMHDATYHYRVVATNSLGSTRGGDMTFKTARDVTKPVVTFTVKSQRIKSARARGLAYLGRCDERCVGNARLTITRSLARRLGTPAVLGKSRIALNPRAAQVTLRIALTKRVKQRLAVAKKGFTATVKIRVADEAGNPVTLQRRVKLTR